MKKKIKDHKKEWYDFIEEKFVMMRGGEIDIRSEKLKEWTGKGKKVLSLGPHSGKITNVIVKGNDIVGIELPKVLERFNNEYDFECLPGNAENLSIFCDETFDVVFAGELLIHLDSPIQCLRECLRVLKNDGFLIISIPDGWLGGDVFTYCFTEKSLRVTLENLGFLVKEIARPFDESKPNDKCLMVLVEKRGRKCTSITDVIKRTMKK